MSKRNSSRKPLSRKSFEERFFSKVGPSDENGCFPWLAGLGYNGYGQFWMGSRYSPNQARAHRVAWEIHNKKPVPKNMLVCHHCDNPKCVNPEHLFIGTIQDNANDRVRKNRQAMGCKSGPHLHPERMARGDRHGSKTHPERVARGSRHGSKTCPERVPRGERNGRARLMESDVIVIRIDHASGGYTQQQLADRFHVDKTTISDIVRRKTWTRI